MAASGRATHPASSLILRCEMTYTVCALTGAWFDDGCIEMSSTCGHRHKTLAAAQKCLAKLTETTCDHGIKAGGRCSFYGRCGSLWSVGKLISTIGNVSAETIKKYIAAQKGK